MQSTLEGDIPKLGELEWGSVFEGMITAEDLCSLVTRCKLTRNITKEMGGKVQDR